jgi:hypothetical protein
LTEEADPGEDGAAVGDADGDPSEASTDGGAAETVLELGDAGAVADVEAVGDAVAVDVADAVAVTVAEGEGLAVGRAVGFAVGRAVGFAVGRGVGGGLEPARTTIVPVICSEWTWQK